MSDAAILYLGIYWAKTIRKVCAWSMWLWKSIMAQTMLMRLRKVTNPPLRPGIYLLFNHTFLEALCSVVGVIVHILARVFSPLLRIPLGGKPDDAGWKNTPTLSISPTFKGFQRFQNGTDLTSAFFTGILSLCSDKDTSWTCGYLKTFYTSLSFSVIFTAADPLTLHSVTFGPSLLLEVICILQLANS